MTLSIEPKRILFVQPKINPPGGAEYLAWCMIKSLMINHKVVLITSGKVSWKKIEKYYNLNINWQELKVYSLPNWLDHILDFIPLDPEQYWKKAILAFWSRLIHRKFEILISAHDEFFLGRPSIQYVHYPNLHYKFWNELSHINNENDWRIPIYKFVEEKIKPWTILSGVTPERIKANYTLVNSVWTGRKYYDLHQVESRVLYPPVSGKFVQIPPNKKELRFVSVGRIAPEKRYEEIVNILKALQERKFKFKYVILGGKVKYALDYYEDIVKIQKENSEWMEIKEDLAKDELIEFLCHSMYGIHGKKDEHFGIAVAEMIKSGCITFIPDNGGQVEIVGNDNRLIYANEIGAIQKIEKVLKSDELQKDLRSHLKIQSTKFGLNQFCSQFQNIIDEYSMENVKTR